MIQQADIPVIKAFQLLAGQSVTLASMQWPRPLALCVPCTNTAASLADRYGHLKAAPHTSLWESTEPILLTRVLTTGLDQPGSGWNPSPDI